MKDGNECSIEMQTFCENPYHELGNTKCLNCGGDIDLSDLI